MTCCFFFDSFLRGSGLKWLLKKVKISFKLCSNHEACKSPVNQIRVSKHFYFLCLKTHILYVLLYSCYSGPLICYFYGYFPCFGCTALVAEIKELKEEKQNEDGVLLAIAAGNRRFVNPNLEFEYSDVSIHDDLYKLVQYSCEEICTTNEQLNKVMRLWTTFLEPMVGVPSRVDRAEVAEDVAKARHGAVKSSASSTGERDGSPGADAAFMNSKQPNLACNGDESTILEPANSCRASLVNEDGLPKEDHDSSHVSKDDPFPNALQLEKGLKHVAVTEKISGFNVQVGSGEQLTDSNVSLATGAENNLGRAHMEVMSGLSLGSRY